ncbi:hypothetical protein C2R22_14050 [Salinigranum rubrum]|uniref:Uncharacterized protein n=1 Tax=Salinigranum rubrum TaxID=755307 RepID=A0A2I8VL14_9EURY|nr:hypothetical protein [Salinigranum rubrum]AUV82622.1 hypothetical protein C2R22_14050 [Salinigranum rubrum]
MSVPDGSDASTDADASAIQAPADAATEESDSTDGGGSDLHSTGHDRSSDSVVERVLDWARHWQAWGVALFSLLVVGWAAFLQPEASPKGYIPIFVGFAALAVGYVYLDEESQIQFASS